MIPPPLHIAFYCSSTSWGGLEMNILRYTRWMQELGYKVTAYVVAGSPLALQATEHRIDVKYVNVNSKYFDLINAWRLRNAFKTAGIDVVWFRHTRDMSVLAWARCFARNKFKLLYQQAMQLGVSKKDFFHTWRFKRIDHWVAPLHFLAAQVKSHTHFPPERISVIPLGLELKRFTDTAYTKEMARAKLGLTGDAVWFGVLGRFDPLKGQHTIIQALAALQGRYPKLRVVLAGESTKNEGTAYEQYLHKLVIEYGLGKKVVFLPFMQEVEVFYKAIDVFVLTSAGETFGMVTIEAMASGCLVIGTEASGTPEILGNGKWGYLYKQLPGELEAVMERALVHLPGMQLFTGEARIHAAFQYDHHRVCASLQRLIESGIPA